MAAVMPLCAAPIASAADTQPPVRGAAPLYLADLHTPAGPAVPQPGRDAY